MSKDHIHCFQMESKPRKDGLFHGKCWSCPATTTAPGRFDEDMLWKGKKHIPDMASVNRGKQEYYGTHYPVAIQGASQLVYEAKRSRFPIYLRFATGKRLTRED